MRQWTLWLAGLLVIGLLLIQTVPARAQYEAMRGFKARAGVFFPSDDAFGDDDSLFHAGLEYDFLRTPVSETGYFGEVGVSVDWLSKSGNNLIPVFVNYNGYFSQGFFYTVGAGIDFLSGDDVKDESGFTWTVGLGYRFPSETTPLSVIVRWSSYEAGDTVDGFSVLASMEF